MTAPGKADGADLPDPGLYPEGLYCGGCAGHRPRAPAKNGGGTGPGLTREMASGTDLGPGCSPGMTNSRRPIETAGLCETDTRINKVCNGLSIPQSMREQLFESLSGGEKTRVNLVTSNPGGHRHPAFWTSPQTIWTCGPPSGWRSIWANSRGRCSPSPMTVIFWIRWWTASSRSRRAGRNFTQGSYSFYAVEKERRYEERAEAVREGAGQDRAAGEGRRARCGCGPIPGNGQDLQAGQIHGEAHRADAGSPTCPKRSGRWRSALASGSSAGTEGADHPRALPRPSGGRTLFSGLGLEVAGGERIALIWRQRGSGKTTLLKMILGEGGPGRRGRVRMGANCKTRPPAPSIVHFDHPERSLVDTLIYAQDCTARADGTGWPAFKFRGGGWCSSRVHPPCPAASRAACAFVCSWTKRSTCWCWTSPQTTWTSRAGSGSRRRWREYEEICSSSPMTGYLIDPLRQLELVCWKTDRSRISAGAYQEFQVARARGGGGGRRVARLSARRQ